MRVKALQKIYYGRRDRMPGETYEMDDREAGEAKILALLGKIEVVEEVPPPQQPVVAEAAAEAASGSGEYLTEDRVAEDQLDQPASPRRSYRRRDMRAQR